MGKKILAWLLLVSLLLILEGTACSPSALHAAGISEPFETLVSLPESRKHSDTSIESALEQRRSIRQFSDEALNLDEISQILWAAQGVTDPAGLRTAPSAGALYPLEIYLLAGNVDGLAEGIYKYLPHEHALSQVAQGDHRMALYNVALKQDAIKDAPAVIVIAAVFQRTSVKYGARGDRYVHMEVGSAAQNVYLQAVALNLGTVFIGAFDDQGVKRVMNLQPEEQPLSLMPVGRRE